MKTKGEVEGHLKNVSNVEIPFGYPDSSGLCNIEVINNVTMYCHNKEKFDNSSISIEATVIQDSEGKDLFRMDNYTKEG